MIILVSLPTLYESIFRRTIREAAEVYVNGERAGFVWRPPYAIEVSKFLKTGKNTLRVIVGNTAINS